MKGGAKVEPARLKPCELLDCEAMCCHDGAWISPREEERITALIAERPAFFPQLPAEPFADAFWKGERMGRKTAARPHRYRPGLLPAHFPETRCVFADEIGRCTLQVAAVAAGEPPWRWKPSACWMHPLRLTVRGVELPPRDPARDPDRDGKSYPGFLCYTRCGQHHEDGQPWREVLAAELAWFEASADDEAP